MYCDVQALPIIPISISTLSYAPYVWCVMVVSDMACPITPCKAYLISWSTILLSEDEIKSDIMCQCERPISPSSDVDYSTILYNCWRLLFYYFLMLYDCLIPEYSPPTGYGQHIPYMNVVLISINYPHTIFNSISLYLNTYSIDILIVYGVMYSIINQ